MLEILSATSDDANAVSNEVSHVLAKAFDFNA
jgi:hypothetical protein